MKSIQTKFMFLILGCVLAAAAVIGGSGVMNAKNTVDRDSAQIMNLMCAKQAAEMDGLLSRIEQSVKTLAIYATGQLESVEKLKNNPAYMEVYTQKLEGLAVSAASNTDGAAAVYVRYNPAFAPPTSGLFWSKTALNGAFQQLSPTDFSGYSPTDVEHVGWYYIPVSNGKATWMEPYLNQNINVYMISYVVPLYMDNQTVGVVGMDIDFHVLTESLADMRVYENGYAFLADAKGKVLYHKDLPTGVAMESTDETLRPVARELENGTSGSSLFAYQWKGEDKKLAFRSLSNGMRLVVTAPVKDIDAAKNQLILNILAATALISGASILLTISMTRKLIRPLKELNVAARKIAAGDLSVTISHAAKDEVGALADSFQTTVSHLQNYIDYINGLAYRDGLTGVKNKTAYEEAVKRLEERMHLERPQFAVVVFDLNNLKYVNDTYGHDFGDMLIVDACRLICQTFKSSPVFRIGGDEFLAILENTDYAHYQALLEKFEQNVAEYNENARAGNKLSIARGIALYNYETDLVFGNVFKRADEAMYQNKAAMKKRA